MSRIVGIDVGGTFTDIVVFDDGALDGFKVPTTPDQAEGVLGAVVWGPDDTLLHGTTAATNALLEEKGARVALVTGEGFEDLIEISRQDRPSLYDASVDRPNPLVTRDMRLGFRGDVEEVLSQLRVLEPEVVAVGLIDAYLDPTVENELAGHIRAGLGVRVVSATETSPEFREYERIATGVLSAYLTPSVGYYLESLSSDLPIARSLVMTSAGGLLPFSQASNSAARLVLSGPAGGVVAAAALANHHGHTAAISFDMGGTSTDVCRIVAGVSPVGSGHNVAGRVNRVPSVPVKTIGAGGGSIGWVDAGGALRVGPRSAGAKPGPAAYGSGGTEPTVTDANLVLGHLPSDIALAGRLPVSMALATRAVSDVGISLRLSTEDTAAGILEVVDSHMEHALRTVTVEEGTDPRDTVLIAFGGAGGLHASRLARRLDIPKVLIPPLSGVFSALGLLLAAPRADTARTVMLPESDAALSIHAEMMIRAVEEGYVGLFGSNPTGMGLTFDCRYAGQSHELEVRALTSWPAIRRAFEESHHRSFGFIRSGEPVEVVTVRAWAAGDPPLKWSQVTPGLEEGRPAGRDGVWQRKSLAADTEISGPGVVVEETSAILLAPDEHLLVLGDGTLEISRV